MAHGKAQRLTVWTAIATAVALFMPACQPPPEDLGEFEQPIQTREQLRIGALLPESGVLASVTQPLVKALVLVRDRANACGGVNQAPVALVAADTRSYPPVEADAMMRLVRGTQIHGAIATLSTKGTPRLIQLANRSQVPLLSPMNANTPLTAADETFDGYWARTILSHEQEAIALAEMAVSRELLAIATVVSDTPDGIQFEQAFIGRFEELGGTVVNATDPIRYGPQIPVAAEDDVRLPFGLGGESSPPTAPADEGAAEAGGEDSPPTPLIDGFDSPPAAVVVFLDGQVGADWMRAIANPELDSNIQWIVAQTPTLAGMLQSRQLPRFPSIAAVDEANLGNSHPLTGALGISVRPQREAFQVLSQTWQSRFDEPMGAYVPQAWDAVTLMLLAAEAGGTNDGAAIHTHLQSVANPPGVPVVEICQGLDYLRQGESIDYRGASGDLNLDSWGNVMGAVEFDLWRITETGAKEIIDQLQTAPAAPEITSTEADS